MGDALQELLTQSLSSTLSPSERRSNTTELVELYNARDTVFACFDVLKSGPSETLQVAATIALKYCLKSVWDANTDDKEYVDKVKSEIVGLMEGEMSAFVVSCLIHSVSRVVESCVDDWGELEVVLKGIVKEMNARSLQAIEFFCECIRFMDKKRIDTEFTYFLSLAQFAFGVSCVGSVRIGEELLGVLISRLDESERRRLAGPCEIALTTYISCVRLNPVDAIALEQSVRSWTEFGIDMFDHSSLMLFLFDIAADLKDRLAILLVFELIEWCLERFGEEIIDVLFTHISWFWHCAEMVFVEGAELSGQSDLLFVQDGLCMAFRLIDPIYVYDELMQEIAEPKSDGQLVAWLGALLRCIAFGSYVVVDRVTGIANMLVDYLQHSNICVRELAIEIIRQVARFGVVEISYTVSARNVFVDPLFNLLFGSSWVLVYRALSALTELLKIASMNDLTVKPMVTRISELMECKSWKFAVLDAWASFVRSAGAKALLYWDITQPQLLDGLECRDLEVRSNCLNAMAVYYSNCQDATKVTQGWNLVSRFIEDESIIIRGSIARMLRLFANDAYFKDSFVDHKDIVVVVVKKALSFYKEHTSNGLSDEENYYVACVLRLFKSILKRHFAIFSELATLNEVCLDAMSDPSLSISIYAADCASYLVQENQEQAPPFFSALREMMVDGSEMIWIETMKIVSRMLDHGIPIPVEVVDSAITLVHVENDDVKKEAFSTLARLAGSSTQDFPVDKFAAIVDSFENNTDIERTLSVMFHLYQCGRDCEIMTKTDMVDRFVNGLDICDFCLWPTPFEALEWVVEHNPEFVKHYVPKLVECSKKLLDETDRNFKNFAVTTEAVLNLNLSLLTHALDGCDFTATMTTIMKKLKYGLPHFFADAIMQKIATVFCMHPPAIQCFALDLICVIVSIFSLSENSFAEMKLSPQTVKSLLSLLKELERLNPNAVRIAASSSLNDDAIQLYKRRVGL